MLGVDQNASMKEISRAYRMLAKKWFVVVMCWADVFRHPDKNPQCEDCQEKMVKVSEAYSWIQSNH
mgnify:CR=1 FL=1